MKNTKNMFLSIISVVALLNSQTSYMVPRLTFELFNKSNDTIELTLVNEINYKKREELIKKELAPGKKAYLSHEKNKTAFNAPDLYFEIVTNLQNWRSQVVHRYHILAPGKTKYLTWNPEKEPSLYPQTGPFMGLMGKYNPFGEGETESGLPLNNNVLPLEIKRLTK